MVEWSLRRAISRAALVAAFCAPSVQALADDKKASLSQQLANPIANPTSVPIQYNALFGAGRGGIPVDQYTQDLCFPVDAGSFGFDLPRRNGFRMSQLIDTAFGLPFPVFPLRSGMISAERSLNGGWHTSRSVRRRDEM